MATPSFLLLFLVVTAAAALFHLVRAPSAPRRTDGPACGHCGYPVYGAVTFICPECGSDSRDVGITVPRPFTFPARALLWTLAFIFLACLLHPALVAYRPRIVTQSSVFVVRSHAPPMRAELTMRLAGESVRWSPAPAQRAFTAAVPVTEAVIDTGGAVLPSSPLNFHVDLVAGRAHYNDASGRPVSAAFDRAGFRAWLTARGINVDDPIAAGYADDAFDMFSTAATQAAAGAAMTPANARLDPKTRRYLLSGMPFLANFAEREHPLAATAQTAFWGLLWLAGISVLYAWGRRRAAITTPTPSP